MDGWMDSIGGLHVYNVTAAIVYMLFMSHVPLPVRCIAFWRDLEIFLVCTTSVILQGVVKFLNSPLNASISSVFGSGWIRSDRPLLKEQMKLLPLLLSTDRMNWSDRSI
jgi:hypothetical protein